MAFGKTREAEAMMAELAQMGPGELAEYLEYEQEQVEEIPDGHLISYLDECVKESYESSKTRRETDESLWEAHETELADFADKEDWQSKIILNKPFTTCLQAKSLIRRGLIDRPDYFELTPTQDESPERELKARFWKKALDYWTATRDSNVPYSFADATEMGFAVGQSMAIKILWEPDSNGVYRLRLHLFEPWKTYPDPDREPRKAWSGLYNIHEEWVDFHVLKDKELQGHYQNIDQVRIGKNVTDGAGMGIEDREEERRRKGQTLHRNKYRKAVLVREFWGTILDENGDIKMENASFTTANGVVIRASRPNPYRRLRWPWVDFSPLPHILRFHGYGLYEGTLSIWKFQNSLMNLYIDNENWRINNMYEVDPSRLMDPSDVEVFPGKVWFVKRSNEGPALIPVLKNQSNLQDVSFMWDIITKLWENGTFVSPIMKGEDPGRSNITKYEVQVTREMGAGVFDSIGRDVEQGGTDLIWAMKEVLATFWDDFDTPSFADVFGEDNEILQMMSQFGYLDPQARMDAMDLDVGIKVEGVSRLFAEAEMTKNIMNLMQIGEGEPYQEFFEFEDAFRKLSKQFNQEDLVKSEEVVEQGRKARQKVEVSQAVDAAVANASNVADKAMGVDLDQPGSTQQQQLATRGDQVGEGQS